VVQEHSTVIGGLCLVMVGIGPLVSLGYGIVLTATPVERAGSASAVMATGGQFGIAVGIGVLGSLARVAVGARPPDPAGGPVIAAAHDAFTAGLSTVAFVSGLMFTGLAVVAAAALRDSHL
jgi:DHA2 family multidrug resistance protein-like MFS transporter